MAIASDITSEVLGTFGKWQLRAMLIIFLCKLPTSWFMAIVIFTAPAPNPGEVWCRPPDTLPQQYLTEWNQIAHPVHFSRHHHRIIDYCHVYQDILENPLNFIGPNKTHTVGNNATVIDCEHFDFDPNFHSLVADFNLVCNRQLLLPLTQCFHIFGLLCGGIIAFVLLKFISPKNVMVIGMLSQIVCGNLTGVIKIYEFHVMFRWLSACTCALMYTSGQMIFLDITSGRARIIVSILFELFWSIGLIFLPVFSLFIEHWWELYIAISMPTILMVILYRHLPDSPRWMLRNGRIHEAMEILRVGGAKNKRKVPDNLENLLKQEIDSGLANPPQANWCSLWDGKPRKRYLLAVHYAWSVYVLLFNSMVLNIRAYGRDHLSMNTIAIAFSEIVGVFIGLYLILYTRRRWLWSGALSITSGILAYFTWFIPETLQNSHVVALEMIPSMAIKLATSTGLCLLMACTADLVSSDRKKVLMFSAVIWSRAWFIWAPFIFVLKIYDPVLPLTVFATLIVIGGILMSVVNYSHDGGEKKIKQGIDNHACTISDGKIENWFVDDEKKTSYVEHPQAI